MNIAGHRHNGCRSITEGQQEVGDRRLERHRLEKGHHADDNSLHRPPPRKSLEDVTLSRDERLRGALEA